MKAIEILPGEKPKIVDIGESFEVIQEIVGKEIEVFCLAHTGLIVYVNANGRRDKMPPTGCFNVRPYQDTILCGPILIVRAVEAGYIGGSQDDGSIVESDIQTINSVWRAVTK